MPPRASTARLTRRQREILRLAAEGFGNREIAHRLKIRPATVKAHLLGAYVRLGVSNRTEAWRALGWLTTRPRS